ncbi:MAG: OmpA family protein, partial [Bacteroidota bacterium]
GLFGVTLDSELLNESFSIEVGKETGDNGLPPVIIPPGGEGIGVLDGSADKSDLHLPDDIEIKKDKEAIPVGQEEKEAIPVTADSGFAWSKIWPWLLVAALILLLIWLARSCGGEAAVSPVKKDANNKPVISSTEGRENNASSALSMEEGESGLGEGEESKTNKADGDEILKKAGDTESGGSTSGSDDSASSEEASSESSKASSASAIAAGSFGFTANSMLAKMESFLTTGGSGKSPVYIMDHARFPYNSPKLNKEAEKELDALTKLLKAYPGAKLDIYGHIDLNEDDYYSGPFAEEFLTLSDIRARCIYRKLIERGIEKDRLSFDGFANNNPLKKDVDPVNRRLELVLIK